MRTWAMRGSGTKTCDSLSGVISDDLQPHYRNFCRAGTVRVPRDLRPGGGIAVVEAMKMQNEIRASICGKVERIFGHWKRCQGYRIVRYIGLIKNQLELTLKAVTYNLRRLVSLATA